MVRTKKKNSPAAVKSGKSRMGKSQQDAIEAAKSNEAKLSKLQALLGALSTQLQTAAPIADLTNIPSKKTKPNQQHPTKLSFQSVQYVEMMLRTGVCGFLSAYSVALTESTLCIKGPLLELSIQQFHPSPISRHGDLFRLPVLLSFHYTFSGWKVTHDDFAFSLDGGNALAIFDRSLYFSFVLGLFKQTKYGYQLFGIMDDKLGNSTIFRCLIDKLGVIYQQFQLVEHKTNHYLTSIACCICDEYTSNYSLMVWNKPKTKLISVFLHQVSPTLIFLTDKKEQKQILLLLREAIRQKQAIQRPIVENRMLRPRLSTSPQPNSNIITQKEDIESYNDKKASVKNKPPSRKPTNKVLKEESDNETDDPLSKSKDKSSKLRKNKKNQVKNKLPTSHKPTNKKKKKIVEKEEEEIESEESDLSEYDMKRIMLEAVKKSKKSKRMDRDEKLKKKKSQKKNKLKNKSRDFDSDDIDSDNEKSSCFSSPSKKRTSSCLMDLMLEEDHYHRQQEILKRQRG